jgi:serine/threonine protein kinase
VKPGNVLIDAKGNAILGDFGISRFVDGNLRRELDVESTMEAERSAAHKVMGSVMYLAPEVRRGEKATAAADAYALGVTFYRMLTGIWYEPGPVAESLLSEFGHGWKTALSRLLSENPAVRLPIPPVEATAAVTKSRRPLVVATVVVLLFAAGAVLFFVRGCFSVRVVTDASHQDVVPEAWDEPEVVNYTFDQFFPLHKED